MCAGVRFGLFLRTLYVLFLLFVFLLVCMCDYLFLYAGVLYLPGGTVWLVILNFSYLVSWMSNQFATCNAEIEIVLDWHFVLTSTCHALKEKGFGDVSF